LRQVGWTIMANQALSVDFGLNIDWDSFNSAVNSVNKLDRQVSKFISGAEKIATVFAAGGIAHTLFEWAEGAVEKYAEVQKAVMGFEHAMNNLGITSKAAIADYVAFAEAQAKCAMSTKEQILETERLLTTFGLSGEALKRSTKAALDLSSGLGVDLRTATMMLGKAFEGNTASLAKLGIQIDENTPKSKIFGEVMRQVEERFGGSASAEMNTYAGKLNLLKKQFDDITETIGRSLMPVAVKVLNWFKDLGTVLEWLLPKLGFFQNEDEQLRAHLERELKIAESRLEGWEKMLAARQGKDGWLSNLLINRSEQAIKDADEMVEKYKAKIAEIHAQLASIGKSQSTGSTVPTRTTGAVDKPADTRKADLATFRELQRELAEYRREQEALAEAYTDADRKFTELSLTEQGKSYAEYFGTVRVDSYITAAKQGEDAKAVRRNTELALRQMKADYAEAGKSIVSGWKQAVIELKNAGLDWKASFSGLLGSATSSFATAFRQILTTAQGVFDVILESVNALFQSILDAFLDLIAQMVAKLAIYGLLNFFTGGTGGLVGKLFGFAEGGLVPGAAGAAVPAIVHGGEYVLPASVVSAIRSGQSTGQATGGMALAGAYAGSGAVNISIPAVNIYGNMANTLDVKAVAGELSEAIRRGVSQAVDLAKVSYKVGYARKGESSL